MTSIEILALIFALLILIKLLVISVNPKKWIGFSKKILNNKAPVYIIYVILTVIVGYIVLSTVPATEIGAVTLFISLLIALSFLPYAKKLNVFSEDLIVGIIKKSWLPIIIWLALAVWILYAVIA